MARVWLAPLLLALALLVLCTSAFVVAPGAGAACRSSTSRRTELRMAKDDDGGFFKSVEKLYHEIVPWGDPSKGFTLPYEKRDKMVLKYMAKTGLSKAAAEKEVDEYLLDKDAWIAKQSVIDAANAKKKQ